MSEMVLACQQLSKYYETGKERLEILHELDLNVAPGEQIAIVGPSGSGKSTLLHVLGGLDHANAGDITLCGEALSALSVKRSAYLRNRYLGFVYQFHHLLAEFSALENVMMPLLIRGDKTSQAKQLAKQILQKVGLGERLSHRLAALSGGERQRAAIARALVTEPACVLADEPTGNLDPETASQVYEVMLDLNRNLNTSLIIVTHDERLAQRMDKIYQLVNGKLLIKA